MNLKRNRVKATPKTDNSLCTFKEAGQILGGLPENTLRENARRMGLTVVDLNDVLPVPIRNHYRLIKSELEAIRDKAVEKAHANVMERQNTLRNALIN